MAAKAIRGVLPVSNLSLADIGDSPSDGSEYLALVRAQAEKLPGTVSNVKSLDSKPLTAATGRQHALRKQFGLRHHFEDADKAVLENTKVYLLSNDAWRSNFVVWFTSLAKGITLRPTDVGHPRQADIDAWRKRLYPMMSSRRNHVDVVDTEDPTELAALIDLGTQVDIPEDSALAEESITDTAEPTQSAEPAMDEHVQEDKTLQPNIRTIASFSNPLCFTLLQYHLKWLPTKPGDIPPSLALVESASDAASKLLEVQLQWIFHFLLRLVPDAALVTPEEHALLRQLTRRLRWIRSKIHALSNQQPSWVDLPKHQQTIVAGLNMIITSTALIFSQRDLCDPTTKEEGEVDE